MCIANFNPYNLNREKRYEKKKNGKLKSEDGYQISEVQYHFGKKMEFFYWTFFINECKNSLKNYMAIEIILISFISAGFKLMLNMNNLKLLHEGHLIMTSRWGRGGG